jgi:hypothetical protein
LRRGSRRKSFQIFEPSEAVLAMAKIAQTQCARTIGLEAKIARAERLPRLAAAIIAILGALAWLWATFSHRRQRA